VVPTNFFKNRHPKVRKGTSFMIRLSDRSQPKPEMRSAQEIPKFIQTEFKNNFGFQKNDYSSKFVSHMHTFDKQSDNFLTKQNSENIAQKKSSKSFTVSNTLGYSIGQGFNIKTEKKTEIYVVDPYQKINQELYAIKSAKNLKTIRGNFLGARMNPGLYGKPGAVLGECKGKC
jgi:hypothetical protein